MNTDSGNPFTFQNYAELRAAAEEHFTFLESRPNGIFDKSAKACQHEARLGRLLVEEALATPVGALFDPREQWIAEHAPTFEERAAMGQALFFLSGPLRLLSMEFSHDSAGKLPVEVVREVLLDKPVEFGGIRLTKENVHVNYRRVGT